MRRAAMITMAIALTGCQPSSTIAMDAAWIRLPAVPGRPAAAYFTLTGGAADAALVAARTPAAKRAELHESMANGMRALSSVPLTAGTRVVFAPGGRHVMLYDLDPRLTAGATTSLTAVLADGRSFTAPARVVGAADPAP
jgi:hypothetical protein